MVWRIEVSATAEKQLAKLDRPVAQRIQSFLRERVAVLDDPRSVGEALKGSELGEFWKYRVGDWRLAPDLPDQGQANFDYCLEPWQSARSVSIIFPKAFGLRLQAAGSALPLPRALLCRLHDWREKPTAPRQNARVGAEWRLLNLRRMAIFSVLALTISRVARSKG